jgi:hypothetical protein
MMPEELRTQSNWLLAHARRLREDAQLARQRAVERRAQSDQAIASLREKRRWAEEAMNRRRFTPPGPDGP